MSRVQFFTLFSLLFISACSPRLTPFTERLYDSQSWSSIDLERIQFYLSDDIVLYRDAGNSTSVIQNGKINIVNGRRVEQIVFRKGTPGVFVFSPSKNKFGISFEEDNSRYLMFGPSKKRGGNFVLLAKKWEKNYGKVTYGNEIWDTPSISAYVNLLVDINKANDTKFKTKKVKGRKIENQY